MQEDEYVKARNTYDYPHVGLVNEYNLVWFSNWNTAYKENQFGNTLELES